MNRPGMLFCFEGLDGMGKSSALSGVAKRLDKMLPDVKVVETKQPGGTALGQNIRDIVLDPNADMAANAELLLFAADAAQLMEDVIAPAIRWGSIVLCDRGYMSNIFYQQYGRFNVNAETIYTLVFGNHLPDNIILLHGSTSLMKERKKGQSLDRVELAGDGFFYRIYKAYDTVDRHWHGIKVDKFDAEMEKEELHDVLAWHVYDEWMEHLQRIREDNRFRLMSSQIGGVI